MLLVFETSFTTLAVLKNNNLLAGGRGCSQGWFTVVAGGRGCSQGWFTVLAGGRGCSQSWLTVLSNLFLFYFVIL